ncbi:MAG: HAD family hydrolase [Pseudomonadales bacterium]
MKPYILWDHDGVLVDTEHWYFEATRRAIEPLGVTLDKARYLQDMALGRPAWEQARALGATEAQVREHRNARDVLYQHYLRTQDIAIDGVTEVLTALADDYRMAIVTTARRADFDLIHRDRDIVRHMQFVLASGDYPRAKPAPDPYLAALERFGAHAAEAIVVEDSERGLAAAVAAGIDCVVVDNAFVRGQDFSAATHRIDHLRALPELLASL